MGRGDHEDDLDAVAARVSAARAATQARGETFYQGPSGVHLAAFPPRERWGDWAELDQDARATLGWLARHARCWAALHAAHPPTGGHDPRHWWARRAARTAATLTRLQARLDEARPEHPQIPPAVLPGTLPNPMPNGSEPRLAWMRPADGT